MDGYSFLSLVQEYNLVRHFRTASGPIISRSKEAEAGTTTVVMALAGNDDSIPSPSTGKTSSGPSLSKTMDYRKRTVSLDLALEMLKSPDDLRTLGSLSQVNQTFYHAYKNESQLLLLSTAKKEYGDLLDPMIEIAESILNNKSGTVVSLFHQRRNTTTTTTPVFNSLLIKALLEIDSVLDTWLRIYEYRGPLGLLNYREMSSTPSLLEFHINESSKREYLRFKDVLLSYWSYSLFHRSVEQYWCICCGPQLPSKMGAFDHMSDIKLFQLHSMYDFMYAIVSSLFADCRLEIRLDANGLIRHILSLGPAYLFKLLINPTEAPSQLLSESQRTEEYFLSESLHAEIIVKRSLDNKLWQKLAGITDCLTDAGHLHAEESLKSGPTKSQHLDWLPF